MASDDREYNMSRLSRRREFPSIRGFLPFGCGLLAVLISIVPRARQECKKRNLNIHSSLRHLTGDVRPQHLRPTRVYGYHVQPRLDATIHSIHSIGIDPYSGERS